MVRLNLKRRLKQGPAATTARFVVKRYKESQQLRSQYKKAYREEYLKERQRFLIEQAKVRARKAARAQSNFKSNLGSGFRKISKNIQPYDPLANDFFFATKKKRKTKQINYFY